MRRRYTSRPTPGASIFAAIIGVFMVIFAIAVIGPILASSSSNNHPEGTVFFVFWIIVAVGIIGYHLVNATRAKGVPGRIIELENEDEPAKPQTSADRLQELEDLRVRKLISETEYAEKRRNILDGL